MAQDDKQIPTPTRFPVANIWRISISSAEGFRRQGKASVIILQNIPHPPSPHIVMVILFGASAISRVATVGQSGWQVVLTYRISPIGRKTLRYWRRRINLKDSSGLKADVVPRSGEGHWECKKKM